MVMMPDKMGWMRKRVCKSPVTLPASAPAAMAARIASTGCPAAVMAAETDRPKAKLPSVVKSGMDRMRKLI